MGREDRAVPLVRQGHSGREGPWVRLVRGDLVVVAAVAGEGEVVRAMGTGSAAWHLERVGKKHVVRISWTRMEFVWITAHP